MKVRCFDRRWEHLPYPQLNRFWGTSAAPLSTREPSSRTTSVYLNIYYYRVVVLEGTLKILRSISTHSIISYFLISRNRISRVVMTCFFSSYRKLAGNFRTLTLPQLLLIFIKQICYNNFSIPLSMTVSFLKHSFSFFRLAQTGDFSGSRDNQLLSDSWTTASETLFWKPDTSPQRDFGISSPGSVCPSYCVQVRNKGSW